MERKRVTPGGWEELNRNPAATIRALLWGEQLELQSDTFGLIRALLMGLTRKRSRLLYPIFG
jgi:hypothetical protein